MDTSGGDGNTSTSPVRLVWNPALYQLQQEAPRPKPVLCTRHISYCPPFFGAEFHGTLNHNEAALLVLNEGDYLIRQSGNTNGFYTLTLRFGNTVKHYKLYYDGQHYVKDKRFDTVYDLVADGLVTLYFDCHASQYIQTMDSVTCYESSPYMTLNRLKRKAVINCSDILEKKPEKELVEYNKPHSFKTHTFKGLNWCEFCGNFLWGFTAQGVKCDDCGFSAHSKCSEKVPPDCCPDLKQLRGVFGIDLTTLVKAHKTMRPFVVDKCIQEVERRGLESEGLYRVSGFAEEIEHLKLALDKDGENADMSPELYDINVIAGTLKLYLRLLPIPLITFDTHPALIRATQRRSLNEKISGMRDAFTLLPPAHYNTLKYLMEHLYRVMQHHQSNRMTSHNLSTVFAPTLMPAPDLTKCNGMVGMANEIHALDIMITHHQDIFS